MFKIESDVDQKTAYVYTPFNSIFNENVKNKYAAKWDKQKNAWCVKIEFVIDIREKMKEIFGRDDTFSEKLVSLKIIFQKKIMGNEISVFGRTILFKTKDNKIQKGYGVVIPGNSYRANKYEIEVDANTQVIVRDFPLPKLGEIANLNNDVEIQIVHDEYDRENALLIRLAEIEKKLEKQGVRVK